MVRIESRNFGKYLSKMPTLNLKEVCSLNGWTKKNIIRTSKAFECSQVEKSNSFSTIFSATQFTSILNKSLLNNWKYSKSSLNSSTQKITHLKLFIEIKFSLPNITIWMECKIFGTLFYKQQKQKFWKKRRVTWFNFILTLIQANIRITMKRNWKFGKDLLIDAFKTCWTRIFQFKQSRDLSLYCSNS